MFACVYLWFQTPSPFKAYSARKLPLRCYTPCVQSPWYQRAFQSEYLALYAHRSQEEADAQVAGLLQSGLLERKSPLLDLACGSGRHVQAFRSANLRAWGLDLSSDLLHGQHGVVRGDMRNLPFDAARFATVTSLFTSFGYFESESENVQVLFEVRRVLRDGGVFLMDHINPKPTLQGLVSESHQQVGEAAVTSRRHFDRHSRRLIKEVEFAKHGQTERWHESVHIYEPDELDALLAMAGLFVERRCADFGAAEFTAQSPRQLVRAVKH